MTTVAKAQPAARIVPPSKRPPRPAAQAPRPAAVVLTDLLRPRLAPTRSREEQAFIELQRGCGA